jgi:hypothetical protein
VRFQHQYQNKGLIKSFVLILLHALQRTAFLDLSRKGDSRSGNAQSKLIVQSAIQRSSAAYDLSIERWY